MKIKAINKVINKQVVIIGFVGDGEYNTQAVYIEQDGYFGVNNIEDFKISQKDASLLFH